VLDRESLLERLGGDEQLLVDVIQLFREDCPRQLAAVRAAIDAQSGELIRTAAHALKGAAGNLSAAGLFEAAKTLELVGAEDRLAAAEDAWRRLSLEATRVMEALRQEADSRRSGDSVCAP
jgi:HPt (histidine-containing phosphotransfer) domain-containing protein